MHFIMRYTDSCFQSSLQINKARLSVGNRAALRSHGIWIRRGDRNSHNSVFTCHFECRWEFPGMCHYKEQFRDEVSLSTAI